MPELPEVEIVRQSLHKKIKKKSIKKVIIRNRNLRFKIPHDFENFLKDKKIIRATQTAPKGWEEVVRASLKKINFEFEGE